jgi:homoserine O-acetyltransferase
MQQKLPTQAAADKYVADAVEPRVATLDANDLLYQVNASRNYDPSSRLETISAPVLWINSADDFINPPELGIAERESKRLKNGTFVLLPISDKTHGHGTHTWAVAWREYVEQFLKKTAH